MHDEPITPEASGGVGMDRREMLKRSALVGGAGALMWAAPSVTTLGSRAFGAENGTPRDCHAISYLAVVIATDNGTYQFKWEANGTCEATGNIPHCPEPNGWQRPLTTNVSGCGVFTVDTSDECCWYVQIPEGVTVTEIVGVAMGAGGESTDQGYCVEASWTNGASAYRFCAPAKGE